MFSACNQLEKRWNDLQVGRQGSYSVERLESFDSYCKATSYARVILVCLLTPLPALLVVILLECLPLRPPSEGWSANWVFWIRLALMVFTTGFIGTSEMATLVPVMEAPVSKILVAAVLLVTAYMVTALAVSNNVGFPLPFVLQAGGLVVAISFPVILMLVFGKAPFTSDSPCRPYLRRYQRFHAACMAVIAIYPFYKALYDLIPSTYRGVTVMVLPIWRFGAKYFMVNATRDLEDFIPQIVTFTVDLYSALFISVCMSSAGSVYLSALFIAADIGQTFLEFREVRANANVLVSLLHDRQLSRNFSQTSTPSETTDLLAMVLTVTRDPSASNITSMHGARLRACLPHPLPADRIGQLQLLAVSGSYRQSTVKSPNSLTRHQTRLISRLLHETSVQPIGPNLVKVLARSDPTYVGTRSTVHPRDCETNASGNNRNSSFCKGSNFYSTANIWH
ncbi:hypothetical protein GQ600_7084 [Phytophthora cactorum]|nr:hypothetical protein GQ600_7084 [Phytophthora cactorum]